jgi:predicted dehydrogenase
VRTAVLGLGSAGARLASMLRETGHDVIGFDPAGVAPPTGVEPAETEEQAIDAAVAVVVASPSSLHEAQALRVLEAGRDVLVEKPLALDLAGAKRVADAGDAAGKVCAVGLNLRFHPGVELLARLVDERRLGKLLFAQASFGYDLRRWRPTADYRMSYSARRQLGGGILLDAVHELDYLVRLLGAAESASAAVAHVSDLETDVEDCVAAWIRFRSGAHATLDLNAFEPVYRRGCVVVGDGASATWDWEAGNVVIASGDDRETHDVSIDVAETYRRELVDFLDAVESAGSPRVSAREALGALALADALRESGQSGNVVAVTATEER